MDLLDFEPHEMYYAEPLEPRVEALIAEAAEAYGSPQAEAKLREADTIQPNHLSVLVSLYRYYFYSHQYNTALMIANRAMSAAAERLRISQLWPEVDAHDIATAQEQQPELVRFYLQALKGAGYLLLRMDHVEDGLACLDHVASLDEKDRLGAKALADVARQALALPPVLQENPHV